MAGDGGGRVVWEGGGVERWGREGGRGVGEGSVLFFIISFFIHSFFIRSFFIIQSL